MATPGDGNGQSADDELVTLLDHVSRLVYGIGFSEGLFPAQWVALRYFRDSPEAARTLTALARFQRLHMAPVSRTVSTLVDKGLLRRRPHPGFKRGWLFDLTEDGRSLLRRDPLHRWLGPPVADMADEDRAASARLMRRIISHMQCETEGVAGDTPDDGMAGDRTPDGAPSA
ncbi:MarR family winged helix-turn-helix transcriptional regulator [Azospirillum picis]|uniref:DNA-binding MarR family transcriptional regulator n=1 Tax=Azospirillum picis TaxID=488438 RepID=A0ABU0MI57_9PROT|nr:MarR family transcriptional regulator [Azospirillum picis]MBP2298824.1 DNA-binding MarR family transcriptional regulator [Azospirillum picis]MDQ0532934.1 DNA-binding MarR family transcriptional regulator [Azospirillum picis]